DEIEAAQLRPLQPDRKARGDERRERQTRDQEETGPEQRKTTSGAVLSTPCPQCKRDRCTDADDNGRKNRTGSRAGDRGRHNDPPIVEKNFTGKRDALARARQCAEHGEVPEQDLQQEWQVADKLEVTAGKPRYQP